MLQSCSNTHPLHVDPKRSCGCVACRVPEGTLDAVLSYCHYSLNDSTLTDLIPYLKRKGMGIINASVLSMGLLTKYVGCPPCLICRQHV